MLLCEVLDDLGAEIGGTVDGDVCAGCDRCRRMVGRGDGHGMRCLLWKKEIEWQIKCLVILVCRVFYDSRSAVGPSRETRK